MQVIFQNIFDAFLGIFSEGTLKKNQKNNTSKSFIPYKSVQSHREDQLEKNILKFYFQEQ